MPTYNEAENIAEVVGRLIAAVPAVHVLVVDDGSPDGTGAIADRIAAANPQVSVLHRDEKAGLGAAYRAGFSRALDDGFDVIVEMDADGSHQPEQLPAILAATADAGLVVGTRWMPGGGTRNWPLRRRLLSRGGSLYVRMALGMRQRDATAGFRAYRADVLRSIDLGSIRSQGYAFQIEMLWRVLVAGCPVAEVPIVFVERELGESKMSGAIVREAITKVARWGVRQRARQVRGVFGPRP